MPDYLLSNFGQTEYSSFSYKKRYRNNPLGLLIGLTY